MNKIRKRFLYITKKKHLLISVFSYKKPSLETQSRSGTWVVNEYINGEWIMPCFPEILWNTLKKYNYIGELK